jgi:ATP-dependent exoDNAse (exonuclease V) beta subunit
VDITSQPRRLPEQVEPEIREQMAERGRWQERHRRLAERASQGQRFLTPSSLDTPYRAGMAEEGPGRWTGRDFGSLFHDLMQAVPLTAASPDRERMLGLARLAADRLGLGVEAAREAAALAVAALGVAEFNALLRQADVLEKEVPLCVPVSRLQLGAAVGDGLVEGSIDLLARNGSRTVILDYKTDRSPAPERYWPQVGLYGLAARACGYAGEDVELALFFVRDGTLHRRRLDAELTRTVAGLAADLASGEPGEF